MKDFAALQRDIEVVFKLSGRDFTTWCDDEKAAVDKVCLAYHLAGIACKEGLANGNTIGKAFYYSVPTCTHIMSAYIDELRRTRDSRYFTGIEALYNIADQASKTFVGYAKRKQLTRQAVAS